MLKGISHAYINSLHTVQTQVFSLQVPQLVLFVADSRQHRIPETLQKHRVTQKERAVLARRNIIIALIGKVEAKVPHIQGHRRNIVHCVDRGAVCIRSCPIHTWWVGSLTVHYITDEFIPFI